LGLVAKPKAGKSKLSDSKFLLQQQDFRYDIFGCKGYLYFHPSVEYDWKIHWQRNMCRELLGTFSDMNRENDNSESCHVLFFRFF